MIETGLELTAAGYSVTVPDGVIDAHVICRRLGEPQVSVGPERDGIGRACGPVLYSSIIAPVDGFITPILSLLSA